MKTVADRKLPEVKAEEMVGGHMKNAKNIPYITLFQPKSSKQLKNDVVTLLHVLARKIMTL